MVWLPVVFSVAEKLATPASPPVNVESPGSPASPPELVKWTVLVYPVAAVPTESTAATVTVNVSPALVAVGAENAGLVTCPVTFTLTVAAVMFGADTVTVWSPPVTRPIGPVNACDPLSAAVNTYGMPASSGLNAYPAAVAAGSLLEMYTTRRKPVATFPSASMAEMVIGSTDPDVVVAGAVTRKVTAAENDDIAVVALKLANDDVLAPLPDTYREVVRLRVERYEEGEIAERVGRSKRSVERILREFQQKLHGLIDGHR